DGCPVKEYVYRVPERYGLRVPLVATSWLRVPEAEWLTRVVVGDGFDAADDWIAEHVNQNDIVISGDIPLAARCLKRGARVLGPKGHVFADASIGDALANRELSSQLRDSGIMTGGPAPFGQRDRSRFLQRLDALVHEVLPPDHLKKQS
ncbi:MAG: YaiI/YqxD family protein, partial [Candidatus Hydrogenedentes bacterium]|nr:YaiI/YqxD family protein [Candidatus Hydrogenedentota bacterium]